MRALVYDFNWKRKQLVSLDEVIHNATIEVKNYENEYYFGDVLLLITTTGDRISIVMSEEEINVTMQVLLSQGYFDLTTYANATFINPDYLDLNRLYELQQSNKLSAKND